MKTTGLAELHCADIDDSISKTLKTEILRVFMMVLSVFVLTSAGFDTSEAGNHYRVATQILTHGSLGFAEPQSGIFTLAPNGRSYASHEIGNTLFLLPAAGFDIALEKQLGHRVDQRRMDLINGFTLSMMPPFYCAITIAMFYALLRNRFRKSITTALGASLALGFCTFVWSFSRNLFDGVLCMSLLTGATLAAMEFKRIRNQRLFFLAMVLYGFGIITRLSMVLPLLAFAAYLVTSFWPNWKRLVRLLLMGTAVLIPFAAWQLYYNHLRTGHYLVSPVQTAQYASNNGLTGNLAVGLAGLLFSPGKSIFLYVPLALISIVCFRRFAKQYSAEAVYVAVLSCLWLVLHAKLASWYGAWGWGPRHFVTIAPVLALPACVVWEWMFTNLWRSILLIGSLSWGAMLSLSSIIGNFHYRLALAYSQGRAEQIIWSPLRGQAMDMIAGAGSNLRIIALRAPIPTLRGYSLVNCYASNTVNVWINTASFMGIPRALLAVVALALIAVVLYSLISLCSIIRNKAEPENLHTV